MVLTNAYALRGLAKFGLVSYAESTNITAEVAAPTREEIASSLWQKDLSITNLPQQASARGAQMAKYCRGVRAFRWAFYTIFPKFIWNLRASLPDSAANSGSKSASIGNLQPVIAGRSAGRIFRSGRALSNV